MITDHFPIFSGLYTLPRLSFDLVAQGFVGGKFQDYHDRYH